MNFFVNICNIIHTHAHTILHTYNKIQQTVNVAGVEENPEAIITFFNLR